MNFWETLLQFSGLLLFPIFNTTAKCTMIITLCYSSHGGQFDNIKTVICSTGNK